MLIFFGVKRSISVFRGCTAAFEFYQTKLASKLKAAQGLAFASQTVAMV
jgi:hypothetical protein